MNTIVYNAVMEAQARVGALGNMSELKKKMEEDGYAPDTISCGTLVKGHCIAGDMDKAWELFQSMQKKNLIKDVVVCNAILDGCNRHTRWDIADKVLEYLEMGIVTPSNFTLGMMVKMYGRRRQVDLAFQQVEKFCMRFGLVVNAQVRTCLAVACVHNGALDRGLQILEEAKSASGCVDAKLYGSLIFGCLRNRQVSRAVELVEEACGINTQRMLPPGQFLDAETLEKLFLTIKHHGLSEQLGIPLAERMRANGIPLSARLLASLLASRSQSGWRPQCQRQP